MNADSYFDILLKESKLMAIGKPYRSQNNFGQLKEKKNFINKNDFQLESRKNTQIQRVYK